MSTQFYSHFPIDRHPYHSTMIQTAKDLYHFLRLQALQHQAKSKSVKSTSNLNETHSNLSSRFRVHGWRWHHLGIERDFLRLSTRAKQKQHNLCNPSFPTTSSRNREHFVHFLQYIINDNWSLHDYVQQSVFFPWLQHRDQSATVRNHLSVIDTERQRLATEANALVKRTEKWARSTDNGYSCRKERDSILTTMDRLRTSATLLFKTSEAVVIPRVLMFYTDKEQLRFNSTVLKHISGEQARISLVIFRDAVERSNKPVVAEKEDLEDFLHAVPKPIRVLGLPYWRKKFTNDKLSFVRE